VIPRFSIVGAVLLTGYLGGAIATHVRVSSPLLAHVLFPIHVAVFSGVACCFVTRGCDGCSPPGRLWAQASRKPKAESPKPKAETMC
jgi:hypothetical protein